MKQLITILFLLFTAISIAQNAPLNSTIPAKRVPEGVKTAFKNEFPTLQPQWEWDAKNYKAIYADPKTNSKGMIVYDPEGKVIRRDAEINTAPTKQ